jgi:hypothetical protein
MTNFEKKILAAVGLLIIIVLAFGVVVFRQQKTITALTVNAERALKHSATQTSVQKKRPPLIESIKQFSGAIEQIMGNQLVLNVKLTDFSKPKKPEKSKNTGEPLHLSSDDFETMQKKIKVNTNENTFFADKKLFELKVGDTIFVTSDKSPYLSDVVMAEKIISIELPK